MSDTRPTAAPVSAPREGLYASVSDREPASGAQGDRARDSASEAPCSAAVPTETPETATDGPESPREGVSVPGDPQPATGREAGTEGRERPRLADMAQDDLDRLYGQIDELRHSLRSAGHACTMLDHDRARLRGERDRARNTAVAKELASLAVNAANELRDVKRQYEIACEENARLLADLDGRSEEAAERWIQRQLEETGIRALDFRNGAEMELEPARELLAHWVAAARAMLGDAPNYSETRLSMDVKVAESPELYTLVVQRHGPGVLTPHEARQKAEAERDRLAGLVAAVREYAETTDDDGIRTRQAVLRLLDCGQRPGVDTAAEGSEH